MGRAHGTGTLVKRGKYYMAKWMVKGKLYTRTTKCTTEREALKKLEEFTRPFRGTSDIEVLENLAAKVRVAEASLAKEEIDKKKPPIKLALLVDAYKADLSTSEFTSGTEHVYESRVNAFADFVKKEYVYEVTKDDVKQFLQAKKSEIGVYAYNGYIATMQMLFKVAMQHDHRIHVNVWDMFDKLKTDKSHGRRELTSEEVQKLCAEAYKSQRFGNELGLIFEIAVYTGLRKSDCKMLKWCDIDMDDKMYDVLPIKTGHNGKRARGPLHPKLYEKLKALKRDESGYVLPHIAKAKSKTFERAINEVFANVGIEVSTHDANGKLCIVTGFHAFRHYFISNCSRNGIPINHIQQLVAHSTPNMSLHYTHTFDSDLRLPDYDDVTERIALKKTTVEALNKAKGIHDLDDFIMNLLKGGHAPMSVKSKSDAELDKALDDMFDK